MKRLLQWSTDWLLCVPSLLHPSVRPALSYVRCRDQHPPPSLPSLLASAGASHHPPVRPPWIDHAHCPVSVPRRLMHAFWRPAWPWTPLIDHYPTTDWTAHLAFSSADLADCGDFYRQHTVSYVDHSSVSVTRRLYLHDLGNSVRYSKCLWNSLTILWAGGLLTVDWHAFDLWSHRENKILSPMKLGVSRRQPHRRSGLAHLPSGRAVP